MGRLLKEYRETKQAEEDFLQWLLIRKLGFWGKLSAALVLWILWLKFAFNLRFMVFFLEFIFFVGIIYGLILLIIRLRHKK